LPAGFLAGENWLSAYTNDYRKRMVALLGYEFRKMHSTLAF
jgi:hypothetical protein